MLRKATKEDGQRLFEWRNDPKTRQQSLNTAPVEQAEHERWLTKSLANPNRTLFIFEENGTPAGTCRIDREVEKDGREVFELSWTIAPEQRGKGLGKKMLGELLALETLRGKLVKAVIKSDNLASVKMVEKFGFHFDRDEKETGIWLLQKKTIVILGGGLFKDSDGRWRTTLGENQSGHFGVLNDRLRVVACAELWKENKNSQIISSGGQGKLKNILPVGLTSSKVIKDELLELGVSAKNITEENKSGTTFEQLRAIKEMIENGKIFGNIHIISNNYHLPRIQAMIEHSDISAVLSGKINLVGAEDVLLRLLPDQWKEFIEQSKKSEAMKKRVESEKKGVEQIKNGLYKFA